jgi:hypothetical protein
MPILIFFFYVRILCLLPDFALVLRLSVVVNSSFDILTIVCLYDPLSPERVRK